jgi:hypothetical protein
MAQPWREYFRWPAKCPGRPQIRRCNPIVSIDDLPRPGDKHVERSRHIPGKVRGRGEAIRTEELHVVGTKSVGEHESWCRPGRAVPTRQLVIKGVGVVEKAELGHEIACPGALPAAADEPDGARWSRPSRTSSSRSTIGASAKGSKGPIGSRADHRLMLVLRQNTSLGPVTVAARGCGAKKRSLQGR